MNVEGFLPSLFTLTVTNADSNSSEIAVRDGYQARPVYELPFDLFAFTMHTNSTLYYTAMLWIVFGLFLGGWISSAAMRFLF